MLTYEQIAKVLSYNSRNGKLTWTDRAKNRFIGKTAGSRTKSGYTELSCKGHRLYAHRVAWLLFYKKWPDAQIDHINGIGSDNRITNLREVTNRENHRNSKRHVDNSSGVQGVYWNRRAKKWQAYICIDYKQKYLGVFEYLVDAEAARKEAEAKYGFHRNHGRKKVVNE